MESKVFKALMACAAICFAASILPAYAQSAWCASSVSPWPGGVWDPETCYYLKPNSNGSITVTGSITAASAATATAVQPTYVEGTSNPLSQTLAGGLRVSLQPTTFGGSSSASASITNTAAAVKNNPGQVYGYAFYNPNASVCYVQFFNVAAAGVTVGTTVPIYSIGIPANGGANVAFPNGVQHDTAIAVSATTTRANATACASNLDANIFYK